MIRRFSPVLALVALVLSLAPAGYAAPLPEEPVTPLRAMPIQATDELQVYIIQLAEPSLARIGGGMRDLTAASQEVTGARELDVNSLAAQAYLSFLAETRAAFLKTASGALGRELEVGYIYDVILNGLTVELTPSEAALVATLTGVKHVEPRQVRQLLTDRGPGWIGAAAAWGAAAACAPGGNCGEGVVVGIVDTGLNFDHPSFADVGGDGYDHTNPLGAGVYKGWCNPGNAVQVQCNDKVIGAWSFVSSGNNPEDDNGHGSHTASTTAGNRLTDIVLDAPTIDLNFDISGVAPHANLIVYDACSADGCSTDDLIAALQQAVTDGVDALNYSISGSGQSPWVAPDEQAFLDLRAAGVFVSASAGNGGPGAATVAHGSPWVTTTAASAHNRALVNAVVGMTSSDGALAAIYGRSMTASLSERPIVYAGNYNGNNLCLSGIWASGTFSNQIVVCDRGNNARVEKAENVLAAGGDGMILANAASNGDEEIGDAYVIPGVHITYDEGVTLRNWLASGSNHMGSILGSQEDIQDGNGDVMAAFSSRGPNNPVPDLIKPDITAPGVDIIAAVSSETGKANPAYDIYSGTSMSSPHMAGAGALMMKAKHPAWSVAEIQSALMTTAIFDNSVREEDGITPADPFDRGAGRVSIADALNAGLLLNITTAEYTAADPETGGDPKTLNYPSMADDACYKSCGWTRTVRNPTGQSMTWNGQFIGGDGLQATLSPTTLSVAAGGTASFSLTADDVTELKPGQWYFGTVTWREADGAAPDAHFPVAVRIAGSQDTKLISKTASPRGTGSGGTVQYSITISNTSSSAKSYSVTDPIPANSTYVNGSATGGLVYNSGPNNLTWSGSVSPAVLSIQEQNLSGFQSMGDLGVDPSDLPANPDNGGWPIPDLDFYYAGTHYTQVVWSVNGTIQPYIGGPITYAPVPNTTMPSSALPNNLIAAWWDDLNLAYGGNWYAVGTTWNGKSHTVFSWENVPIKNSSQTATFQIWIEDGTDNIWFAYPSGGLPTGSPTATVGAENVGGTAGVRYYYNGAGKVPDGTKDLRIGFATTKVLAFQVNATGPHDSNMLNEVSSTASSTTTRAWANVHICGPAVATPVRIAIQARRYALLDWSADGSPANTFQVWRSTTPYFTPGDGGTQIYAGDKFSFVDLADGPTVGNPATNYYYVLRTVSCSGGSSADSVPVAEFSFDLTPGQ